MNQRKLICYEEKGLPLWIRDQLAMGTMGVFFPVSFIMEETNLTAVFQTDGYRPLSQIQKISTEDVFRIFCHIVMAMENNEKHYLLPEQYVINRDTVYFDLLSGRVKMIFLLNRDATPGVEQLCYLAQACNTMVHEEGEPYLESLIDELQKGGASYRSIIHRCELLQQEIYVCDIP